MDNSEYDKILLYLTEDEKYNEGEKESEKRRIRKRAKNFTVSEDGKLLHKSEKDGETVYKTVVTKERRKSAIKLCHKGHLGRDKTYEKCNTR